MTEMLGTQGEKLKMGKQQSQPSQATPRKQNAVPGTGESENRTELNWRENGEGERGKYGSLALIIEALL